MKTLSHSQAFQVLLLQAADEGREAALFGDSVGRARDAVPPFLVGDKFPDIYFEHPLYGDPFLDVTVLLEQIEPGTRIASPAAGDHAAMLDWCSHAHAEHSEISFGFELDAKQDPLPAAAIHFQPRGLSDLVRPFCAAVGEPERAELYLDLAQHMPDGWPLSFFGMFRGRPGSPLRVCGYLANDEKTACAHDRKLLSDVFDAIGFSAYDDAMLGQISTLMEAAPLSVDFQFDVYPGGELGSTFAIDIQFGIEQPPAVRAAFESGPGARVMGLFERWGAADGRWRKAVESAFARALPVELDNGTSDRFAFTLMPQWTKARWVDGVLQPAKLYHLAHAGLLESAQRERTD